MLKTTPLIHIPNSPVKKPRHPDLDQTDFDPIKEMEGKSGTQLLKDIKQAKKDYEDGKFVNWDDFKKELFAKD